MATPIKNRNIRILVADDETLLSGRMVEFLKEKGFEARFVNNGKDAFELINTWRPEFVFVDLMLPEFNALSILRDLQSRGILGDDLTKVFVMSGQNHPTNIKEAMKLGASDFLVKPLKHADLFQRIVLHLQPKREVNEFRAGGHGADFENAHYFLHLTDLLLRESLKGAPIEEALHNLTGLLGMSLKAVRVSLVQCDAIERTGRVFASSDKKTIGGLAIDLVKYPEILYVLRTEKLLALDNLVTDSTMHFVTQQEKEIAFNSMIVAPVKFGSISWGVVSVKMPDTKTRLNEFEIRFAQLAAHVMGLLIQRDPMALGATPPQSQPK